jgi:localization factor PodJL
MQQNYAPPPQAHSATAYAPPQAHEPTPAYAPPPPSAHAPSPYSAAPPTVSAPGHGPGNWAAQILARQRVLDAGASAAAPAPPAPSAPPQPAPAAWENTPTLAAVEQQLRQINSQISTLHQPYEDALNTLRHDLAEISRALTEAAPRQAIEALEGEIRALAERLDRTRQAGTDGNTLRALERGLAEVRDALRSLSPAESLVGFEDAVHALSHKIDRIAAATQGGGGSDPLAIRQLEEAVVSLRSIVPNVASDQALVQLSADVQTLAGQFERATAASSAEALRKLEARITTMMDRERTIPAGLEGAIHSLSERLDRMPLSQGDQLALGALEHRIDNLSEKLDTSDARLRQFDAIERGLGDLLVYLEEMRQDSRGLRAAPPPPAPEPAPAPSAPPLQSPLDLLNDRLQSVTVASAQPSPLDLLNSPPQPQSAPRSPLDLLNDPPQPMSTPATMPAPQPAPPPTPIAAPASLPAPPAPPVPMPAAIVARPAPAPTPPPPRPMARAPERAPIEPYLPPDTPLEPGSGTPRVKPGSAAARIAASEAALGQARPVANDPGGKSAVIAAARNAAKAAYLDSPAKVPRGLGARTGGLFKWPFKKKPEAPIQRPSQNSPKLPLELPAAPSIQPAMPTDSMSHDPALDRPLPRSARAFRLVKTVLIAASVAIIVIGAAQTAFELLFPEEPTQPPMLEQPKEKPQASGPLAVPNWPTPTPMPPQGDSSPLPPPVERAAPAAPDRTSFFDPATMMTTTPQATEVTGSIARQPTPPRTPATPAAGAPAAEPLHSGISTALRTAAAANNPAADYEIGARYAEGRGVPQSSQEAVRWFEKAANAGFVPAQFRLASLNEKGDGVKKDVQAARRLYLAAAGKGHAKAMHNLAVLYAEGIDGRPDFKAAGQWFRKAAGYGITDSQYNLAILYARGIGVEQNLAESYKWFALAAANGDTEAGKKRDELGSQLDKNTLTAAKLAIQTFVPDREPEEATNLRTPPGGWDRAAAAPATPRRRAPASPAQ